MSCKKGHKSHGNRSHSSQKNKSHCSQKNKSHSSQKNKSHGSKGSDCQSKGNNCSKEEEKSCKKNDHINCVLTMIGVGTPNIRIHYDGSIKTGVFLGIVDGCVLLNVNGFVNYIKLTSITAVTIGFQEKKKSNRINKKKKSRCKKRKVCSHIKK